MSKKDKQLTVKSPAVIRVGKPVADHRIPGKPIPHDLSHNCLSCMYRPSCQDPSKAFNYRCDKWTNLPDLDFSTLIDEKTQTASPILRPAVVNMEPPKSAVDLIKERELSEVDLEDMVVNALANPYAASRVDDIDDRDIPVPPNFYTWFSDPQFAGQAKVRLWAMQMKMTSEYLGEYCPRCSDLKYLRQPKVGHSNEKFLEKVTLLVKGVCPRCKSTKSEMIKSHELPNYYRMAAVLGQRSGKNALATQISAYSHALWLKTPNPQDLYGLPRQQYLNATYVALTFAQAKKNYWDPFHSILQDSAWFKNLHGLLDYYGEKKGEELYAVKDIFLRYRHKNLFTYISGPNKRTLRGDTRSEVAGDEFGWFPVSDDQDDKERMGGPEIVAALARSLTTLIAEHQRLIKPKYDNNHIPKPIFTMISSPSEINDVIMTEYKASAKSKIIYGIQRATWEINPKLPRSFFDEEFEKNADKAMRDFGAQPPMSSMGWIKDLENAKGVFSGKKNNVNTSQKQFRNRSGITQTSAKVKIKNQYVAGRVLALDAGYVGNSFAYAIGTLVEGVPTIEAVGEIVPNRKAPLNFTHIYRDVISTLISATGCRILISDRWQNIRTHQDAEEEYGTLPVEYRVRYGDFEALREAIYNQEVVMPRLEGPADDIYGMGAENYPDRFIGSPVQHLLYQMLTVRDYPGKTVEKGGNTTDDIFRAVVLAYKVMTDPDYMPLLVANPNGRARALGAVVSSGSGGNGSFGELGGTMSRGAAVGTSTVGAVGGSFSRK